MCRLLIIVRRPSLLSDMDTHWYFIIVGVAELWAGVTNLIGVACGRSLPRQQVRDAVRGFAGKLVASGSLQHYHYLKF